MPKDKFEELGFKSDDVSDGGSFESLGFVEKKEKPSEINPLGLDPFGGTVTTDPAKLIEGVKTTGAGFIQGLTGGLADPLLEKAGVDLPEGNIAGNIAGFAAGPGKLARFLTKPAASVPILGPVLRGGAEGFAAGASISPGKGDEFDFAKRAQQGAIAAPFGIAAEALGSLVSGTVRFAKASKQKRALEVARQRLINSPQFDARDVEEGVKRLGLQQKTLIKEQASAMDQQLKALSKELRSEVETKAQAVKRPILTYMRKFKDDWGKNFDEILESSPQQGMTVKELRKIEDDVFEELSRSGIELSGPSVQAIKSFSRSRLTPSTVKKSSLLDRFGNEISEEVSNLDKVIPNKAIIQAKRKVASALSSNSKNIGQYTPDDVAGVVFNGKLADALEETVSGLKEVNKKYREFSELSRFTYKNFKPKASEFEISSGANLIKKVASGKANEGQIKAVRLLEKNTGINFTSKATDLSKSLDDLKSLKRDKIQAVRSSFESRIAELHRRKRSLKDLKTDETRKINLEIAGLNELTDKLAIFGIIGRAAAVVGSFAALGALGGGKSARQALDILN